jgi:hypothetical protein
MENINTPTLQHSNTPKKFKTSWQFDNIAILANLGSVSACRGEVTLQA